MNFIKVILWDKEIGRLAWDPRKNLAYFIYNSEDIDQIPDIAPLLSPKPYHKAFKPIYGDSRSIYHRLPPFLADSLPDYWGNLLFSKWIDYKKIPKNIRTPLYRLTFMGKRGMGAFEFEPVAEEFNSNHSIDLKSLYDLSVEILENRFSTSFTTNDDLTLQSLLQVGTSAGGRQKKAIIAINGESGEIRSGQIAGLPDYDYYILKFGEANFPAAEIEMTYYSMAVDAGIEMKESKLFRVEGINHFLTKRFDRKNGKKILIQTLAAINPDALNYEDLFATCRALRLSETEISQLYRRLVFNILANNTDDHIKNFSFMLEEGGRWKLSPAYDLTFVMNATGTGPNEEHVFSIGGKFTDISNEDLLFFAKNNDIKNPQRIINEVAESLKNYPEYAEKYGITQPFRPIIERRIKDRLKEFGYLKEESADEVLTDARGRKIKNFQISINTKGMFVLSAVIDGEKRRIFIRKNMKEHKELSQKDIYSLSPAEKLKLTELL